MTPAAVLERVRQDAAALADAGRYTDARDAYLVAADAAETLGRPAEAWTLRIAARRMHIVDWARRELDPRVTPSEVTPRRGLVRTRRLEVRRYLIVAPLPADAPVWAERWQVFVNVDNRGSVRIVERSR